MAKLMSPAFAAMLIMLSVTAVTIDPALSSATKPSVPEFNVSLADHSYDVAPVTTSTTNPYNNKTTTTTSDLRSAGSHTCKP